LKGEGGTHGLLSCNQVERKGFRGAVPSQKKDEGGNLKKGGNEVERGGSRKKKTPGEGDKVNNWEDGDVEKKNRGGQTGKRKKKNETGGVGRGGRGRRGTSSRWDKISPFDTLKKGGQLRKGEKGTGRKEKK